MGVDIWNERYTAVRTQYCSGVSVIGFTVGNTVTSNPSGTITRFTSTAHGIKAGSQLFFAGFASALDDFNGLQTISAVAANTFDIDRGAAVIATPAGTETAKFIISPEDSFQMLESRLHLSAAATQENYTITLDSALGADFDVVIDTQAMNTLADVNDVWGPDAPRYFSADDQLIFAFPNTDGETFGLEVKYRIRR